MLETFIQWVLIGTFIKVVFDHYHSKSGRRRRSLKHQLSDLFVLTAIIVILALMVT